MLTSFSRNREHHENPGRLHAGDSVRRAREGCYHHGRGVGHQDYKNVRYGTNALQAE